MRARTGTTQGMYAFLPNNILAHVGQYEIIVAQCRGGPPQPRTAPGRQRLIKNTRKLVSSLCRWLLSALPVSFLVFAPKLPMQVWFQLRIFARTHYSADKGILLKQAIHLKYSYLPAVTDMAEATIDAGDLSQGSQTVLIIAGALYITLPR